MSEGAKNLAIGVIGGVFLWFLIFVGVDHQQVWWWIEVHTGTVNEPGPYYGFWSGFGSDIGEYVIVAGVWHAIYLHWKAVNCHEPGCWRIGRFNLDLDGVHYKACQKHHPVAQVVALKSGHMKRAFEEHRARVARKGSAVSG